MEVTFVRHGQSEANANLTENPDSALTEIGKRQAEATAERLKDEGYVPDGSCWLLTSPLLRTLMTAEPISLATEIRAELFPDICEFFSDRHAEKYRRFVGLSPGEIKKSFPFVVVGEAFPCADRWWPQSPESDATLYSRALRVRDILLERFNQPTDRVVIVSHADPIGRLIEAFLRLMPDLKGPAWTDNGSVSRVRVAAPGRPAELILLNDTSHLEALGISTPA